MNCRPAGSPNLLKKGGRYRGIFKNFNKLQQRPRLTSDIADTSLDERTKCPTEWAEEAKVPWDRLHASSLLGLQSKCHYFIRRVAVNSETLKRHRSAMCSVHDPVLSEESLPTSHHKGMHYMDHSWGPGFKVRGKMTV